eukprot:TRINITY_DN3483_c0_g1_i1.p1 TRINITY_DN3483_c0_g1~~TRINITY_DN3483_c0_g1_i1.p1  ORF type:complete len:585 (-),score=208.43 TRINITY_DN3483_c0_g1_i1:176-1930(-)
MASADADTPPAKRARTDQAADVCKALEGAQVPGSASMKELLLLLAPPALQNERREASDAVVFKVLAETFDMEEQRLQAELQKTHELLSGVQGEQGRLDAAAASAKLVFDEKAASVETCWEPLRGQSDRLFEVRQKLRFSSQQLLDKELKLARSSTVLRILKDGSWQSDEERQRLLEMVEGLLARAPKEACLASEAVVASLAKEPKERRPFDLVVVEAAEAACANFAKQLEGQAAQFAAVAAIGKAPDMESWQKDYEALERARAWRSMSAAKHEIFELTKAGLPEPESFKEQMAQARVKVALGKLVESVEADTSLKDAVPSVLQKEPAARGEYDGVVLREFEAALDRNIAKLRDGLSERALAAEAAEEIYDRLLKRIVLDVQADGARRTSLREQLKKQRDDFASFREEKFEPLKKGHQFETNKERTHAMKGLVGALKKLPDLDEGLSVALPLVLKRLPSERSEFEQLLLAEVEKVWDEQAQRCVGLIAQADKDLVENCSVTEANAVDAAFMEEQDVHKEIAVSLAALNRAKDEQHEARLHMELKDQTAASFEESKAKAHDTTSSAQVALVVLQTAKESLSHLRGE